MNTGDADLIRFERAARGLFASGLRLGNFGERASAFLAELVPSEMVVFGSLDRESQRMDMVVNQRCPAFGEAMEAYGQHMGKYRHFAWDPSVNEGKPFFLSDFTCPSAFRQTGMYSDVYRVLGIDNHCAVLVPGVEQRIDFLGIERSGGPDFAESDRWLLTLAQRHLSQARALAWEWEKAGRLEVNPAALQAGGLSNREAETLYWITEGKSNEEVGMLLGLRLQTVKGYVKSILRKLGVESRLGAALWAVRTSQQAGAEPMASMSPRHTLRLRSDASPPRRD